MGFSEELSKTDFGNDIKTQEKNNIQTSKGDNEIDMNTEIGINGNIIRNKDNNMQEYKDSLNPNNEDDDLRKTQQFIEKQYFPIFLKINDYKPLYFPTNGESTLRKVLKEYIKNSTETDEGILIDI